MGTNSGIQAPERDDPGVLGIAEAAQAPAVEICRAVYGGTLFLREHPEYLPQWEKEKDDSYQERLTQSVLFNAYKKSVTSLTGIVFREPPSIGDDVDKEIVKDLENIDLSGQHVDLFAQQQFKEKMIDGHDHIIVDWSGPEGARSRAEELESGARPYWTLVKKRQVLRHWVRQDGGATILTSWAYQEKVIVQAGNFAQKEILRVRQFDLVDGDGDFLHSEDLPLPPEKNRRVLFRSWRQEQEGAEWIPEVVETLENVDPNMIEAGFRMTRIEDEDGTTRVILEGKVLGDRMTRIPVVTDYAERTGFMTSEPPLLDLALENLKHWQIRSDRDQNLHVTSIPILNVYGIEAKDLQTVTVGTALGMAFPEGRTEQGSDYTEAQGNGLKHTREELLDIQARMAALGISMLERQVRVAETEKAKMLDQKAQDSELAALARRSSDALEEALVLHAMWKGLPPEKGGSISVNTDFSTDEMSPELFDKYLKAVKEGKLTLETFWDRLMAGGLLPKTFDAKKERLALEKEGISELEAMAELQRRQRTEVQMNQGDPNQPPPDDETPSPE